MLHSKKNPFDLYEDLCKLSKDHPWAGEVLSKAREWLCGTPVYRVALALEDGLVHIHEIMAKYQLTRSQTQKALDGLIRQGLVERRRVILPGSERGRPVYGYFPVSPFRAYLTDDID